MLVRKARTRFTYMTSKNNSELNNKTPYGCSDLSVLIDAKLGRNQLPDLKRLQPENIVIID